MTSPTSPASPTATPSPASAHPGAAAFVDRHVGPRQADVAAMLTAVGSPTLDALVAEAVPAAIRTATPIAPSAAMTEAEAAADLRRLAARNRVLTSMIGLGYHGTHTPAVIRRNVLENPAWYTAYTPYQPEISQGRLEAMLVFQTMVEDLTALPVAGASLLDEATAVVEAVLLMRRAVKGRDRGVVAVDARLLPQSLAVLRGRAAVLDLPLVVADLTAGLPDLGGAELVGVVVQQPGADGLLQDVAPLVEAAHAAGGLVTVAADLLSLTLVTPPGEAGADIAVGSAQRFGVPMFYGGPHAAYMAVRAGLERQLPGRLVGVSVDADGAPAYRLALQTREQHIRREKATSNICTAQALLAVVAAMYAVHHGPEGLRAIAEHTHAQAVAIRAGLRTLGIAALHERFFDTVVAVVPGRADAVVAAALDLGVNLRLVDADHVALTTDETTTDAHVGAALTALAGAAGTGAGAGAGTTSPRAGADHGTRAIPADLERTSPYLAHPTFHAYRSETALMRYLRRLADKDLALDRTMIPLGSCTMKLNAAVELEAISWPGFADLHPYAPADQAEGYHELTGRLEAVLADLTGYAAVSLQPNAGSQGELAGLLAIRGYHRSRGDGGRDVCLIPASAHGTNAASAVLAGMRVVVVATAPDGEIDVADLHAKLAEHGDRVAAIMITYPSTHGVFEAHVRDVAQAVHAAGGQVYIDGANLNALVGLVRLGEIGGDVSHLNLHKTFAIPHGGGGPGVGPVAVAEHLVPFLPGDPTPTTPTPHATTPTTSGPSGAETVTSGRDRHAGLTVSTASDGLGAAVRTPPVAGARYGSAGVLPISYAYVMLMGGDGLRHATETAILAANYLATRLAPHFPVLYTGPGGRVAHECILDLRAITKATGVTAEDVAKRLMDYGFHAPTLSFPVAGTLMVEPTESEDLAELDRFVEAMVAIRGEIADVEAGRWSAADSPLRGAPHTAASVMADGWDKAYSRETAAFGVPGLRAGKYWPPVRRIDQAAGDRNLVCACPPIEQYATKEDA